MPDSFCQIAKKRKPAFIIYEDKQIMAFLDIEPFSKGHTLIIPKKHSTDLEKADPEILKKMIILTVQLAKILKDIFKFDGVIFTCTSGKKLQDVEHLHFHLFGKNKNQKGFYYQKLKNRGIKERELQKTVALIKEKMDKLPGNKTKT